MKKLVRNIVCTILLLSIFLGTISISAATFTDKPVYWKRLYELKYTSGSDSYSVAIYRNEKFESNQCSTQFKFIAYDKEKFPNGIEYITNKYNWKISSDDYKRYYNPQTKEDKTFSNDTTLKILEEVVKKDTYLSLNFSEMYGKRNKIEKANIEYLCLNCSKDCKIITVCSRCSGNLFYNKQNKKYVCFDCGKARSLSLQKKVCSTCKNENYIKVSGLWQITTDLSLKDVKQHLLEQSHIENFEIYTSKTFFENCLLNENWKSSSNNTIINARLLADEWDKALELYNNPSLNVLNFDEIQLIKNAVYQNRCDTFSNYSNSETKELIEKYIKLAKNYILEANTSSLQNLTGQLISDDLIKAIEIWSKITEHHETFNSVIEKIIKGEDCIEDLASLISCELDEIEYSGDYSDLIHTSFEFINTTTKSINQGKKEAQKNVDLCFTVADDFSNYYKASSTILLGQKLTNQRIILNLSNNIALAATMKNTINKIEK